MYTFEDSSSQLNFIRFPFKYTYNEINVWEQEMKYSIASSGCCIRKLNPIARFDTGVRKTDENKGVSFRYTFYPNKSIDVIAPRIN